MEQYNNLSQGRTFTIVIGKPIHTACTINKFNVLILILFTLY